MNITITEEQFQRALKMTQDYAPKSLPPVWKKLELESNSPFGLCAYERTYDDLTVIFTAVDLHGDGKIWLHVSLSRLNRLPTYKDMAEVKDLFIGEDREALQIFAKKSRHINFHPYCLHLWCAVEGNGLPDFGKEGTI